MIHGVPDSVLTRKCEKLYYLKMRIHVLRNRPPIGFASIDNKNREKEIELNSIAKRIENEISNLRKKER